MLHARARNPLDTRKLSPLILQPLQHQIDSFEKQGRGRKHLAFSRVGQHALVHAIFCQVGVEIDFGFVDELQV
jgi:hypothetical protein